MRTQQRTQRCPQATPSLLAPPPLLHWQPLPCASSVTMSETAHSPWTPSQVASGAPHGSSPVCCGSASCKPGFTGSKTALVRSASSEHVLLHSHASVTCSPFSVCVEPGASPLIFFSLQLGPVNWRVLSHSCLLSKNNCSFLHVCPDASCWPSWVYVPGLIHCVVHVVLPTESCLLPVSFTYCWQGAIARWLRLYLARHCRRFTFPFVAIIGVVVTPEADPEREDNILEKNKTRLALWEKHFKDPIVALDTALKCVENSY